MQWRFPSASTKLCATILIATVSAVTSTAQGAAFPPAYVAALRAADARLATIAYRLQTANAPLCVDRGGATGLALHALGQFDRATRGEARTAFAFPAEVAVEAVVPGSPAAAAGIRVGQGITAIDSVPLPAGPPDADASSRTRDAAWRALARAGAAAVTLTLTVDGRAVRIVPVAACRTNAELLLGPDFVSRADGSTIQIGSRYLETFTDEEVAVLVAHELAHNILRHRDRLDAAGVSRGVFAEVGRNGRLIRQTEDEADRLGVWLLRNAGWDAAAAPRFWRTQGGRIDHGVFRSRTHRASKDRATLIEAEIAAMPAGAGVAVPAALLALRDAALS